MIGYDEIKAITADAEALYPPRTEEGQREWWSERGVDYDGLVRFCAEDGMDSFVNSLPEAGPAPIGAIVAAGYAMSTEIGFLLGWLACEQHIKAMVVGMDT